MGQSSGEIPNEQYCPAHAWAPEYQPDQIWALVSDIVKLPGANPDAKDPPNYFTTMYFINCGYYSGVIGDWYSSLFVYSDHVTFVIDYAPAQPFFVQDIYAPLPEAHQGVVTSISEWYSNGFFTIALHGDGDHPPYAWDAQSLFGIPTQPGYFADEFDSDIATRFFRYACHKDGTNVKIWTEPLK